MSTHLTRSDGSRQYRYEYLYIYICVHLHGATGAASIDMCVYIYICHVLDTSGLFCCDLANIPMAVCREPCPLFSAASCSRALRDRGLRAGSNSARCSGRREPHFTCKGCALPHRFLLQSHHRRLLSQRLTRRGVGVRVHNFKG